VTIRDLRALIAWAEQGITDEAFWRRLWTASAAYDKRTEINIKALVINHGQMPLDKTAKV
jgi:hypothetical protein